MASRKARRTQQAIARKKGATPAPIDLGVPTTIKVTREEIHTEGFSGPLPDPETLAKYEQMIPGVAERLVHAFESEIAHRRKIELDSFQARSADAKYERRIEARGQWLGFVIGLAGLGVGLAALLKGAPVTGGMLGGSTLAALVYVFVVGRRQPKSKDSPG